MISTKQNVGPCLCSNEHFPQQQSVTLEADQEASELGARMSFITAERAVAARTSWIPFLAGSYAQEMLHCHLLLIFMVYSH